MFQNLDVVVEDPIKKLAVWQEEEASTITENLQKNDK